MALVGGGAVSRAAPLSCGRCRNVDPGDLRAALQVAGRHGPSRAQVFVEERDSTTLRWDAGHVQARTDRDVGAAVRVTARGITVFASTNVITRVGLEQAAEVATAVAAGTAPGTPAAVLVARHHRPIQPAARAPDELDLPAKASLVARAGDAALSTDRRIRSAVVTHVDVVQHVVVADMTGSLTHDIRIRTRATCRAVARDGNRLQAGFEGPGTGGGLELFDDHPPEQIGRQAAERAVHMLDGRRFSAKDTVVVLGPGGGGLFLHEACGHGLEADGLDRGTSIYARTAGRTVASPLVTAVDDPSLLSGFGSYAVDDEGTPSAPTVLIEGGVQVGAVTDRTTASSLPSAASANGRCESYAHPPLCRLSNTHMAAGTSQAADVVGDVASGLYVARLSGGQVDIASGEFAFSSSEAWLIENGDLTVPIAGATVVGHGPRALAAIDAVGDDLAFTQALCGKEGQWVPVSYGSPTIRIPGLRVVPA